MVSLGHQVLSRLGSVDEIGMVILEGKSYEWMDEGRRLAFDLKSLPKLYRASRLLFNAQKEIQACTTIMLLLNGEFETAWNFRKNLVKESNQWEKELFLCDLVLSKHFKSSATWAHRKWLLDQYVVAGENHCRYFDHELKICHKVCQAYPRCYNSWSHRNDICKFLTPKQLDDEMKLMREWFPVHVSDFSSMFYMKNLITASGNTLNQLQRDIIYCSSLVAKYPGHEALWKYKSCLVHDYISTYCYEKQVLLRVFDSLVDVDHTIDVEDVDLFAGLILGSDHFEILSRENSVAKFLYRDLKVSYSMALDEYCANKKRQRRGGFIYLSKAFRKLLKNYSHVSEISSSYLIPKSTYESMTTVSLAMIKSIVS